MVVPDGTAKGLRIILAERGLNTERMKVDNIKTVLPNHDDFRNDKAVV